MRKIIIAALILAMSFSLAGCSDITWLLDLNHSSGSSRSTYATDNGRSSLGPPPYTCCVCGEAPGVCGCGRHYAEIFERIDGQYYCQQCSDPVHEVGSRSDPQTTVDADTSADDLRIGETVSFGGSAWTILDIQGTDVLLLSEYCVNVRRYDDDSSDWDNSEIKAWLNGGYLGAAFSDEDRAVIIDRGQGNVFILSIEEARNYSVQNGGIYKTVSSFSGNEYEPEISWWLRSSGSGDDRAAYLSGAGNVFEDGISVTNEYCGVRPAIWIELQ